jgi:DNA gyrase subunit A
MGRTAQGVKIFNIDKPDFVIGVDRIVQEEAVYREKEREEGGSETDMEAGSDADMETGTEGGEPLEETEEPPPEPAEEHEPGLFDEDQDS